MASAGITLEMSDDATILAKPFHICGMEYVLY